MHGPDPFDLLLNLGSIIVGSIVLVGLILWWIDRARRRLSSQRRGFEVIDKDRQ